MTNAKIKLDFTALLEEGGAFDRLEKAVLDIREILLRSQLSPKEESILGHGGLPGEYLNSLWPASKRGSEALKNNNHGAIIDGIQILFISLSKPSQLSISLNNTALNDVPTFSVEEAIPKQIELTLEWLEGTQNLSHEDKERMWEALNTSQQAFKEIKSFRETNCPQAFAA